MNTDSLAQTTVKSLLADVAGGSMAPGGIGMAALSAAQTAALVSMVCCQTAGKPGYEPMTEEMERVLERARQLEEQVLIFLDQEVEAFNKLMESAALPRGLTDHDEQTTIRREMMRIAARSYVQVPYQVGLIAAELLPLVETVIRYGNRELVADAGTALFTALAALRAAALQVSLNLKGQEADEWVATARERVARWCEEAATAESELWPLLQGQAGVQTA
ncbi:MAG: cyclodeaminase/cyclohydrolase family protein [Candidatus Sericytochromatia bacterium]|nr:cyclodeaminase/cyclohydrolase family protein [Candidatus Sericytochromatia bacterium]